jgi:hypothetical protein
MYFRSTAFGTIHAQIIAEIKAKNNDTRTKGA